MSLITVGDAQTASESLKLLKSCRKGTFIGFTVVMTHNILFENNTFINIGVYSIMHLVEKCSMLPQIIGSKNITQSIIGTDL